jgi:PAS domain S-box-containing protein
MAARRERAPTAPAGHRTSIGGLSTGPSPMSDITATPDPADRSTADPLLRTLVEASPLAIYLLDRENRVQLWNPAAQRVFGWSEEEVLGGPDPTLRDRGVESALIEDVRAGGAPVEREVTRFDRAGTPRDVSLSLARVPDENGETWGVMAIAVDVTDRRRLERERDLLLEFERQARADAEAAERRARFLAESSSLLDGALNYHATLDNLARLAVQGLADYCLIDELEGDAVSRVAIAHADPEREPLLKRSVRQPLSGDPAKHPVVHVIRTGHPVLVEVVDERVLREIAHDEAHLEGLRRVKLSSFIVVPLATRGKTLGAITMAYADSGRRYTMADLQMAEELARRAGIAVEAAHLYRESRLAVQARERLMAVVSHDLRNSLATVLLNASAILESSSVDRLEPTVRDQLQWIARSAEQMNRLISDLLDVSAIELGRLSLHPSTHTIAALMRDASLMYRPLCLEKEIDLELDLAEEVPEVIVDPERFLQVLGNLIGNAIKFSPPGSVIRLSAERFADGDVCIRVSDQGDGIEPDQLPTIFEMFRQGPRGRRRGAGLGLGIARAIVEAQGGRIWVDSRPEAGSTFSFTVPAHRGPASAAPRADLL